MKDPNVGAPESSDKRPSAAANARRISARSRTPNPSHDKAERPSEPIDAMHELAGFDGGPGADSHEA